MQSNTISVVQGFKTARQQIPMWWELRVKPLGCPVLLWPTKFHLWQC